MCGSLSLIELGMVSKPVDPCLVWGLNFSIRKEVFLKCGGFHPDCIPKALQRYQGDGETGLTVKIKEMRLAALYHPGAAVTHVIPASRLTLEAFERRAFYQGVCDSYARIRRGGLVPPASSRSWKDTLRPIKEGVYRSALSWRGDAKAMLYLMGRANLAGRRFHENECRYDPKLLAWVLKPDYFDYTLPEGWKNYTHAPARS
jgi:hypothetical protein